MTTRWAVALVLSGQACTQGHDPASLALDTSATTTIRGDCSLARVRCSRCHSIERVERAHIAAPRQWRDYVRRMRLMPGSGVPPEEEWPITRCFVYLTSGQRGVDELALEENR
ncbi:MAG: hypothetical protein ABI867_39245 [Kofleriaceae bacterium]